MRQKGAYISTATVAVVAVIVLAVLGYYFYSHDTAVAPKDSPAATSVDSEGLSPKSGASTVASPARPVLATKPSDSGTHIATTRITVTSPNGGERWDANRQYTISWSHANTFTSLAYARTLVEAVSAPGTVIEYRKILGNFPGNISGAPDYVEWVAADGPDRTDYKIRVSYQTANTADFSGSTVKSYEDTSDRTFSITTKNNDLASLMLINPNGGQTFKIGSNFKISWKKNKLGTPVIVELYKGNTFISRISSALGSYGSSIDWTVGSATGGAGATELVAGSDYRIRLSTFPAVGYDSFEDFSDAIFTISK